ncbi:MAG TPA: ABC-F family ATP-binding cassette domain-containing protein [Longimicrobiales bacterium]|nr:ABC-F family ATP-binding cassette domain-containing protein [Longimicrobiales bacterium]
MHDSFDSLLIAEDLTYGLNDGRTLLDGVTVGFGRERTGLIGANGVGKTTLARLLLGDLTPAAGRVIRNCRVGYLPQRRSEAPTVGHALGVAHTLQRLQRVLSGDGAAADIDALAGAWDLPERIAAVLARVGLEHLDPDRPLSTISGGEATRVALARLLLDDPGFLILDEPTNDLDARGRKDLQGFVDGWSGGLLVISHDRALLRRMDRILELSTLGVRLYGGNYDAYREQRRVESEAAERELAHARTRLKRTRREVQEARERHERRASQGRKDRAAGGVPKILLGAMKERSENTGGKLGRTADRRLEEARDRARAAKERVEDLERLSLSLPPCGLRAGKVVLRTDALTYAHRPARHPVLDSVSLTITGPERIAIVGRNGAGKTTLLRLLAGELVPGDGTVHRGVEEERIAYLDQRAARLRQDDSVLVNLQRANPALDATTLHHTLARFLFRGDDTSKPVSVLSGGERLRAALACALAAEHPPQLLLLDEPTNHLDLDSQRAVEDVLAEYDGALVLVSHDLDFLEAVGVDRHIELP